MSFRPAQPRMTRPVRLALVMSMAFGLISLVTSPAHSTAEDSLQVIDNPGGGHVVFGPVSEGTPRQRWPQFCTTYTHALATAPWSARCSSRATARISEPFFTVNVKSQGSQRIAGLVIISVARGATPAAAVLYDDSGRFAKTEPVLLHSLTAAWRTAAMPSRASGAASSGTVPPLTPTPFPDGSGAVSLPVGWRITFASHGAAKIVGPRGETVLLQQLRRPYL